jgi:hypothetical protein
MGYSRTLAVRGNVKRCSMSKMLRLTFVLLLNIEFAPGSIFELRVTRKPEQAK